MAVFGANCTPGDAQSLPNMFQLATALHDEGISESMPSVISSASVPIIKFRDKESGIMVDISFEVKNALSSAELIKKYIREYPLLRPLTLVIKYYLKQKYLNETWTGGIGSYTLVVMVLSFLQLQTPSKGKSSKASDGEDLSTLVIKFLQFYGSRFDYFTSVISVLNGGSYLRKADKNWISDQNPELLSVEDPQDPSSDIAARSYRIQDAKDLFMSGFMNLTTNFDRWPHTYSFLARLFDSGDHLLHQDTIDQYSSQILHSNVKHNSAPYYSLMMTPSSSGAQPNGLPSSSFSTFSSSLPTHQLIELTDRSNFSMTNDLIPIESKLSSDSSEQKSNRTLSFSSTSMPYPTSNGLPPGNNAQLLPIPKDHSPPMQNQPKRSKKSNQNNNSQNVKSSNSNATHNNRNNNNNTHQKQKRNRSVNTNQPSPSSSSVSSGEFSERLKSLNPNNLDYVPSYMKLPSTSKTTDSPPNSSTTTTVGGETAPSREPI